MPGVRGNIDLETGWGKAATLFWAKRLDESLQLARQTAQVQKHAAIVYDLARKHAVCVSAVAQLELPADQADHWRDRYGAMAVELLNLADQRGYFLDLAGVETLDSDQFLAPVRSRTDFDALRKKLLSASDGPEED